MHPWVESMVQRVQRTPPACLKGFRVSAVVAEPWNHWATWSLACQCGSDTGRVLGYPLKDYKSEYDGPELFLSPLAFECSTCTKTTEIIDTKVHGYDAECDKLSGRPGIDVTIRGSGPRQKFGCPDCGEKEFRMRAECAHSHFDLIEDEPELEPRVQDFFDAFGLKAACKSCGKETTPASYELA